MGGQDNLKDPKCNIGRQKSNVSEIMTGAIMKKTPFSKYFEPLLKIILTKKMRWKQHSYENALFYSWRPQVLKSRLMRSTA